MFEKESRSRHSHSMKIRNHEDTDKYFYEEQDEAADKDRNKS
jgi:hypothetical protein